MPDQIEVHYELTGQGKLDQVNYLAGYYTDYKDTGFFPSSASFKSVFNPEPNTSEQRVIPAAQSTEVNVTGMSRPGREDWFMTPAPYCFGMNRNEPLPGGKIPEGNWLMMGVVAPAEKSNFISFAYDACEGSFSLRLDYEGQTEVDEFLETPHLVMSFADDPYQGIEYYSHNFPKPEKAQFEWWKQPIFCGWGSQVELAGERENTTPQDLATQAIYDTFLQQLEGSGLKPGIITIDDVCDPEVTDPPADTPQDPEDGSGDQEEPPEKPRSPVVGLIQSVVDAFRKIKHSPVLIVLSIVLIIRILR